MEKTILLADDELDILKVTVFRLKKSGYKVLTAEDGQEALKMIKEKRPDLVLLDLALPLMDGYAVCKEVKSDEALKKIPIIFFTAASGGAIEENVTKFMADGYIKKPFEPEELISKIKGFIG